MLKDSPFLIGSQAYIVIRLGIKIGQLGKERLRDKRNIATADDCIDQLDHGSIAETGKQERIAFHADEFIAITERNVQVLVYSLLWIINVAHIAPNLLEPRIRLFRFHFVGDQRINRVTDPNFLCQKDYHLADSRIESFLFVDHLFQACNLW